MNIKYYIKKVDGLSLPKRANDTDAGYDVVATTEPMIKGTEIKDVYNASTRLWSNVDYIEYGTNLYIVPDSGKTSSTKFAGVVDTHNVHTDLRPRSSISSKTNFVLANSIGLIDRGYHNQVMVRFKYIFQPSNLIVRDGYVTGRIDPKKMYNKGDAIAQILPMLTHDINFEIVDMLPGEDRGGGFGSTDVKKETPKNVEPVKPIETPKQLGFRLGSKTTASTYYSHSPSNKPLISIDAAEIVLRQHDGDIYEYVHEYVKGTVYGLCVVDGSGQILTKVAVFSV